MNNRKSFRFGSRKQYEKKIAEIIFLKKQENEKAVEKLDREYENILDEYIEFCSISMQ